MGAAAAGRPIRAATASVARPMAAMNTQTVVCMTEPAVRATATMIARRRGMNVRSLIARQTAPAMCATAPMAQAAMTAYSAWMRAHVRTVPAAGGQAIPAMTESFVRPIAAMKAPIVVSMTAPNVPAPMTVIARRPGMNAPKPIVRRPLPVIRAIESMGLRAMTACFVWIPVRAVTEAAGVARRTHVVTESAARWIAVMKVRTVVPMTEASVTATATAIARPPAMSVRNPIVRRTGPAMYAIAPMG